MTAVTLTDRYVAAAARRVPERQRDDLARELRASIADQIDARVEQGEIPDAAERAVLTGLGDPDKLAADFIDRPLTLIGPRYYLDWLRLLTLLLWIVLPCAAFGIALGQTLAGESLGAVVGSTIGITLTVGVHLCFWVTLSFAMIEYWAGRTGEDPKLTEWSVDNLPEPPEKRMGLAEMIVGLVWLAIGAGLISWDRLVGFVPSEPGLAFLDPALWPWWVGGALLLMAVSAVLTVLIYVAGRWTYPFAVLNAIVSIGFAVPALWLLSQRAIVNPAFWDAVLDANAIAADVPAILTVIFGFVIAGIAAWSIVDGFVKARRSDRH